MVSSFIEVKEWPLIFQLLGFGIIVIVVVFGLYMYAPPHSQEALRELVTMLKN